MFNGYTKNKSHKPVLTLKQTKNKPLFLPNLVRCDIFLVQENAYKIAEKIISGFGDFFFKFILLLATKMNKI